MASPPKNGLMPLSSGQPSDAPSTPGSAQAGQIIRPGKPGQLAHSRAQAQRLANDAELLAAAKILEEAGDHVGAAELRVEHAKTQVDLDRRLDILRDAVARLPHGSQPSRHANAALAQALGDVLHLDLQPSQSRGLALERAHALVAAGNPDEAGAIFENLGLLDQAIDAYTRGGCLAELEYLLRVREHAARTQAKQREVHDVLLRAHHAGRRNDEMALLQTALSTAADVSDAVFLQALRDRERQLRALHLRPDALHLKIRQGAAQRELKVWQRPSILFGRSPSVEVAVVTPTASREHARLEIAPLPQPFVVRVFDHLTKFGTFVDGEVVDSDEGTVVNGTVELMLGTQDSFYLHVESWNQEPVCWIDERGAMPKLHQVTRGPAPLVIDSAHPELVRLIPKLPCPILDFSENVQVWLNGHRLRRGADPEILAGDRLRAQIDGISPWEIEVMAGSFT